MKSAAHRVLLVDDDLDEQFLTQRALKKTLGQGGFVHLARSANEAIEYLIGEGRFADRSAYPFPSIVITDLNMPDGDGFKLLEFLKSNSAWSVVPRIMFTSSEADDDVRTAFFLGASAYHVKPFAETERVECMHRIIDYWSTSRVPPVDANGRILPTNSSRRPGNRYTQEMGNEKMKRPPS